MAPARLLAQDDTSSLTSTGLWLVHVAERAQHALRVRRCRCRCRCDSRSLRSTLTQPFYASSCSTALTIAPESRSARSNYQLECHSPRAPLLLPLRTIRSLARSLSLALSFDRRLTRRLELYHRHSLYIAAAQKRQDKYCALYIVVQSVNSEPYAVELKHCADDDFEDLGPAGAFVTDDMQLHLVLTNHWVIVVASSHASADSSVWFVSHSDLKTAYAKNTMADARRVLLSGVSAIADLHADLHDGADGEKVRMFFLSTPHHLHDEPVRANEELRNGSRAVYPSLPSSDQAPVDACPRIVTADFEPRGLRLASIVHNTAALRGTVSGVPFSADQKLVTTSYWLSLGTWPELDTVRTAGVLHIDAPVARRQRAALYSTSHDGGMLQVWEAPTVSWLSGLAQIPASAPGSEQQEVQLRSQSAALPHSRTPSLTALTLLGLLADNVCDI